MWVVELLVCHGFKLSRVSDCHAAEVSQKIPVVVWCWLALFEARVDSSHHASANHADFVKDDERRVLQVLLEPLKHDVVGNVPQMATI